MIQFRNSRRGKVTPREEIKLCEKKFRNFEFCRKSNWKKEILGIVLIVFVSGAIYWDTLKYDFVHDDIVSILRNADVRPATPWSNLLFNDFWGTPMSSHLSHKSYRPLTILTFRLNFMVDHGVSAYWFHLTNVLIHAVSSAVLFSLCLRSLAMPISDALVTALLFATHPIHTEAVAGITGRSDSLACLLMLLSFLVYSRCLIENSKFRLVTSGILGCLAMLAKETGITALAINVTFDLYVHFSLIQRWFSGKMSDASLQTLRQRITFTISLVILCLTFRLAVMNGALPVFSAEDNPASHSTSFVTRLLTYAFLPGFNLWLILRPEHLSYDWQMGSVPLITSLTDHRNLVSLCFYFLFGAFLTVTFKTDANFSWRNRRVVLGFLFTSLPFLPASNLFFPVGFVAAERILYAPSAGICILTGTGFHLLRNRIFRHRRSTKAVLSGALCLVLLTFSLKTMNRSVVWKSRATLFESGLLENPGNAKVHYNYGNLQKDLGNLDAAMQHYKAAIRLWPTYASAWNNLGAVCGEPDLAEMSFLNALRSHPEHTSAHFNLGVIYLRGGRLLEATQHLEEVVFRLDPAHAEALRYLGTCYKRLNRTEAAETVFENLSRTTIDPFLLHANYGHFLLELGGEIDALRHFILALAAAPSTTENTLQVLTEAVHLANHLQQTQLFTQLATRLLRLKFDPTVANLLANAYAEQGNHHDAKAVFQKLKNSTHSIRHVLSQAQFLLDAHEWSEAEAVLRAILKVHSNHLTFDPDALLLLARALEGQSKSDEALEALNLAIQYACPKDAQLCAICYTQLGNHLHTQGLVQSASYHYSVALNIDSTNVQAHANLGAILHIMGNYSEAKDHYTRALHVDPTNIVVLQNLNKLEKSINSKF